MVMMMMMMTAITAMDMILASPHRRRILLVLRGAQRRRRRRLSHKTGNHTRGLCLVSAAVAIFDAAFGMPFQGDDGGERSDLRVVGHPQRWTHSANSYTSS